MTRSLSQTDTANLKAALRAAALALRDALPAATRAAAAEAIAARAFPVPVAAGTIVAGFSPLKTEINPIPLLRKLADAGAQLALPVVAGTGTADHARLGFRRRRSSAGVWGIREPTPEAPEVAPDICSSFARCSPSNLLATASATAPAITI